MKIAVLIADSYGEPFEEIRNNYLNQIWKDSKPSMDVFTMLGHKETPITSMLNFISNSLKYSRIWPVQRAIDKITLSGYKFRLPKVSRVENNLNIDVSEGLRYLGPKFLASIQFLYQNGYDVVYKCTLSSVVQVEKLLEILRENETESVFYAGSIVEIGERRFVSGANLALNRKAIELIKSKRSKWDFADYDDVALGKIVNLNDVVISEINTLNIGSLPELERVSNSQLSKIVHFRCKSTENPRNDIQIIDALLKRLAKINAK
jgi:hypothetical protein